MSREVERDNLIYRLRGERYDDISGRGVPVDAISLERLADVLMEILWPDTSMNKPVPKEVLKPGVWKDASGRYRLNGQLIKKDEAFV